MVHDGDDDDDDDGDVDGNRYQHHGQCKRKQLQP